MSVSADFFLIRAGELLAPAGRLTLDWSRELCHAVDHSGHDCAAYHGIWPYILLFGLATGPQRQRDFYSDAIRGAGARVLISGAADYNLAATALWAYAMNGVVPQMTLIDVCETPLSLTAWFGGKVGVPIATVAGDILDYRSAQPYDAIVAHSFIGLFAPDSWGRLFAAWHDLLVPGGRVVMVHRVRPDARDLIRFSAGQATDFHARFIREASLRVDETGIAPEAFPDLIDGFVAHNVIYPLRSPQELVPLLEGVGFRIETLQVDPTESDGPTTSPGPTLAGGVGRVKLMAIRQ